MSSNIELDAYNADLDPHRFTFPAFDLNQSIARYIQQTGRLYQLQEPVRRLVRKICLEHNVGAVFVNFHEFVSRYSDDEDWHEVVRVSANGDSPTSHWKEICRLLHVELKHSYDLTVHVELLDVEKAFVLQIQPVLNDDLGHAVNKVWAVVRGPILQILQRYLSSSTAQWSAMCVFLAGSRNGTPEQPTIIVKVQYRAVANWGYLKQEIMNVFQVQNLEQFQIEFAHTRERFQPHLVDRCNWGITQFRDKTTTGDSIGIEGSPISGSIGPAILLKDPNSTRAPRSCLLTCHHVTRTESSHSEDPREAELHRQELPLQSSNSSNPQMTRMFSPAPADFAATMALNERRLNSETERLELLLMKNEDKQRVEPVDTSFLQAEIAKFTRRRAWLRAREQCIGRTIASSGMAIRHYKDENHENRAHKLDWALVEVSSPRFWPTFAPTSNDGVDGKYLPRKQIDMDLTPQERDANRYTPSGLPIDGAYEPEPGEYVVMRGRTSGISSGIINYIKLDSPGWPGHTEPHTEPYTELIVLAQEAYPSIQEWKSFCQPGDSGSSVFNKSGQLVGIAIGEWLEMKCSGSEHWSILTPMPAIIKDIEERTSCKVLWPRLESTS